MRFLQRVEGVTLFNKVHSSEIQKSLDIEPLHFSELKDIGFDGLAMYAECLMKNSPNKLYLPKQMGKEQQLDDLDYMKQLHWGSWIKSLRTLPKRYDGGDGRP